MHLSGPPESPLACGACPASTRAAATCSWGVAQAPGSVHDGSYPVAYTRHTPGIHPAYTRRTPGVHPAYTRHAPGMHPGHTRRTPGRLPWHLPGLRTRAQVWFAPAGATQDAQGRGWPSQGGGRRPPPNGVPPRHAPSLQMWTKLDFLPSDAVRSRIAVFAAFSSPGHTSLSRHFPGDPPGDPWGLPLCHSGESGDPWGTLDPWGPQGPMRRMGPLGPPLCPLWQRRRPLGPLSTSAP